MKKIINTLICFILLFATVISVTACNRNNRQEQSDDLQAQLEQQQEQLKQLEELLRQQQEKNEELEQQYSSLIEQIQKMQTSVNRLDNAAPYKVVAVAESNYVWSRPDTAYILHTPAQLQQFFDDLDAEFENFLEDTWQLRANDGTVINKTYFNETVTSLDGQALIVSVFFSPCMPATVTRHYLWKDADKLHVEIDYTHGMNTAIVTFMVIMKVDSNLITDVNETILDLNYVNLP